MEAELPANGSLGPLFYAFGLITREQLLDGMGSYGTHDRDTNFVQWLQETVQDAVGLHYPANLSPHRKAFASLLSDLLSLMPFALLCTGSIRRLCFLF